MSKLPKANQFLDLSDYGRPIAIGIANSLKNTAVTPIHMTWAFVIVGVIAMWLIITEHFLLALILLIVKSILDAADGELARVKNTPSYTGRYFDSISDWLINLGLLLCISFNTETSYILGILAFISMELQGTLYNYYYVILRNKFSGDTTSRITETEIPKAHKNESQSTVNVLYSLYQLLYAPFDKLIYYLDRSAASDQRISKTVMTLVSTCGLGFQLLLIGLMATLGWVDFIIPFFILYNGAIPLFIGFRRVL